VTTTPATGDLLAVSIATPVMLESADAASVGGVGPHVHEQPVRRRLAHGVQEPLEVDRLADEAVRA